MTVQSAESARDPCPEIPESFVDPTRIVRLARELKKQATPQWIGWVWQGEVAQVIAALAQRPVNFRVGYCRSHTSY